MTRDEYLRRKKELEIEWLETQHDEALARVKREVAEEAEAEAEAAARKAQEDAEADLRGWKHRPTAEDQLNVEDFELYVSVGTSKDDLKAIFLATDRDLDMFCRRIYGLDFKTAYNLLLKQALGKYKKAIGYLAEAGNATAMNTINQLTLNMSQGTDVKIKVIGAIPTEEKRDD